MIWWKRTAGNRKRFELVTALGRWRIDGKSLFFLVITYCKQVALKYIVTIVTMLPYCELLHGGVTDGCYGDVQNGLLHPRPGIV